MVGSDVATTCTSRIAMNMPMHIVAKPTQVFNLTGSVWCVAGFMSPVVGGSSPRRALPWFRSVPRMTAMSARPAVRALRARRKPQRNNAIVHPEVPHYAGRNHLWKPDLTASPYKPGGWSTDVPSDSPIFQNRGPTSILHRTRWSDHRAPTLRTRLQLSRQGRPEDSRSA